MASPKRHVQFAQELQVVLARHLRGISTRRPRGAPIPRAMRGFVSQNLTSLATFPRVTLGPHPPECVYPTQRSRITRFNEARACIVPHVTLVPRVYCPAYPKGIP